MRSSLGSDELFSRSRPLEAAVASCQLEFASDNHRTAPLSSNWFVANYSVCVQIVSRWTQSPWPALWVCYLSATNVFFIDTIRRVNRVRRLLSYRSMKDRSRYGQHAKQHLQILELLERGKNQEASEALRLHLASTLKNISKIRTILE